MVRLRSPRSCRNRFLPAPFAASNRRRGWRRSRVARGHRSDPQRGLPGVGTRPASPFRRDANPTGVLTAIADTARLPTAEGRLCAVKRVTVKIVTLVRARVRAT